MHSSLCSRPTGLRSPPVIRPPCMLVLDDEDLSVPAFLRRKSEQDEGSLS
ncbi:MAG: hypothetical protein M3R40_14000 [Pseudomonadota bacterium]|nr:hypothetical protein [Pseudomonadota bacterium]